MNLAPNGKPTNLTPEQYRLVRTPAFKKWFGDWEKLANVILKDPAIDDITLGYFTKGVSKVVDENGEPKVMWHGSDSISDIKVFKSKKGYVTNYFASDVWEARRYTSNPSNVKPFFLNAKKFLNTEKLTDSEKRDIKMILSKYEVIDYFITKVRQNQGLSIKEYKEELGYDVDLSNDELIYKVFTYGGDNWILLEHPYLQEYIIKNNYDGYNTQEGDWGNIAIFNPNQIKLADGSNTTFDGSNPDIRFDDGGTTNKNVNLQNINMEKQKYCVVVVKFDNNVKKTSEVMPIQMAKEYVKRFVGKPEECEVFACTADGEPINKIEDIEKYAFGGGVDIIENENGVFGMFPEKAKEQTMGVKMGVGGTMDSAVDMNAPILGGTMGSSMMFGGKVIDEEFNKDVPLEFHPLFDSIGLGNTKYSKLIANVGLWADISGGFNKSEKVGWAYLFPYRIIGIQKNYKGEIIYRGSNQMNKFGTPIDPKEIKRWLTEEEAEEMWNNATETVKMRDGGNVEEVDLFERFDELPIEVQEVLIKFGDEDITYESCKALQNELEPLGYTFEYGLDAEPYGLKKIKDDGNIKKAEEIQAKITELKAQKSAILRGDGMPNQVTRMIDGKIKILEEDVIRFRAGGTIEDYKVGENVDFEYGKEKEVKSGVISDKTSGGNYVVSTGFSQVSVEPNEIIGLTEHTEKKKRFGLFKDGGTMNTPVCVRCGCETNGVTTMSMFNEDIICIPCKDNERNHPNYKKAVDSDNEAIKGGDYNFKGIGMKDGGNTPSVVLKQMSNTSMWRINSVELVKSENGKYHWVALDSKREVVTKGENEFNTPDEAQADFQATKLENGGGLKKEDSEDISQYYDNEFAVGTFIPNIKQKQIITEKIGLSEQNADYLIGMSPKFAVWLADSIVKDEIKDFKLTPNQTQNTEEYNKKYVLNRLNERPRWVQTNYANLIRKILDWLMHPLTPKQNLRELSLDVAERKAEDWHEELQTLGGDVDYKEPEGNKVLKRYPKTPEGAEYYWVQIPKSFCDVESKRMGHCGRTGASDLISLRSIIPYGKGHTLTDSHVTIAWDEDEALFYQVKGKKNQKPSKKYHDYIFDLIKDFAKDEDHKFKGFGVEYDPKEDYGFEDMSKEQVLELYKINKNIFNNFEGEYLLYNFGIKKEKPNTIITIEEKADDVDDLLKLDRDIGDTFVYQVLTGEDTDEWFNSSWGYHYKEFKYLVGNLDKENEQRIIKEIQRLTKHSKKKVTENGINYYLGGEDEDFDEDVFDNIVRAMVNATTQAEEQEYIEYYYEQIKDALEELGTVKELTYEGVKLEVDLLDKLTLTQISAYLKEVATLDDVFKEAISDGDIELPSLSIDDRYSAYAGDKEFNAILKDISLEDGYKRGGTTKKEFMQDKIGKVMHEFKHKELKTPQGKLVTNPKQAIAIGYSEGRTKWKIKKRK